MCRSRQFREEPRKRAIIVTRRGHVGMRVSAVIGLLIAIPTSVLGQQVNTGLSAAQSLEDSLVKAIAKCEKSVVSIARARRGEQTSRLLDADYVPAEYATGVVVDQRGLILTNYHVLGHPEKNDFAVWVGRRPFFAKIRASDPWTDLAVLEIEADDLTPMPLGDASKLRKGQLVIALGNPYAIARDGSPSATWGIVSNLGRYAPPPAKPTSAESEKPTLHHFGTLIQTDARLNKGTSGGALLNLNGEMVGLTTALAALSGYERAAGYAIAMNDTTKRAINHLKEGRRPEYGFLGVNPEPLSVFDRRSGKLGVRLRQVVEGTPAALHGLRAGDVITHVNDQDVDNELALIREVSSLPAGSVARLRVNRENLLGGTSSKVQELTLSKKYVGGSFPGFAKVAPATWRGLQVDYVTALADFYPNGSNIDSQGCIAVTEVTRDSAAWKAGIRERQFITHVDGQRVSSPPEFYAGIKDRDDSVTLTLASAGEGDARQVVVEVER